MSIKFTNNASTRLAAPINTSTTTITVESGGGDKFPVITAEDYFPITVVAADASLEIMKCTARTADTFTVDRAQEGTTAKEFTAGSVVELRFTAGAIEAVMDELQVKIDDAEQALDDKIDTVEGYKVGDYLTTARNPGANWLRRDGSRHSVDDYPDLSQLMPPAPLELNPATFGAPIYDYTSWANDIYGGYTTVSTSDAIVYVARGAGGTTFGAYRSTDGGETWTYHTIASGGVTTGSWCLVNDGDALFLSDIYRNNRVYYSLNGGVSWSQLTYSGSYISIVSYDDVNDVFVGFSTTNRISNLNKVFKTNTVTGASSLTISETASYTGNSQSGSCIAVHGYCILGIQGDKDYLSTNYGATRTAITVPGGGNGYLGPVGWIAGKFYVEYSGKIYSTTNFSSYTEVLTFSGMSKLMSISSPNFLGFAGSSGVAITTDGDLWSTFSQAGKSFSQGIATPSPNFDTDKLLFGTHVSNSPQAVEAVKAKIPEGEEFLVPNDGGGRNWIKAL